MPTHRIDPLTPVPPYRQIAAIIKRGILSGQYPPDTRIPTESELVETYEVARSTARRAVAALREEGLLYTVGQLRGRLTRYNKESCPPLWHVRYYLDRNTS